MARLWVDLTWILKKWLLRDVKTKWYCNHGNSVSNKKGPQALSPWKLRRALWKANVWAQKALKKFRIQIDALQIKSIQALI